MPSYMDLQAEFVKQNRAYAEYQNDLRMKAQQFFAEFRDYLSVPDETMKGVDGEHLPYVDLGKEVSGNFVRCNRMELPFVGSDICLSVQVNFVQERTRAGIHYNVLMSKRDLFYNVAVAGQSESFRVSGESGTVDFTEVFELLALLTQGYLRQRP